MSEDNGANELARLRAIGEWMREVGASELSLDGLSIKLEPRPHTVRAPKEIDPDEAAALSEEERAAAAEKTAEEKHNEFWRRATRSSGAPIPPFRPKRVA